jgi:predicted dehydrogenase
MIGLDTSHVIAFTAMMNDPSKPEHVSGARVVAGFKGGSTDIESSYGRVDNYTADLRDRWGVKIVDSIPQLCTMVDAVMIESVDGRPHLAQAKPVIEAGLPFFIDKPMAGSLADAIEIARLARKANVPWFSSSSLRFAGDIRKAIDPDVVGKIVACDAYSPCSLEPHHPDLFWYGIHGVEILYAAMGPGCVSVSRVSTPDMDVVVGQWKDGRVGTFRGMRTGKGGYGCTVFGEKAVVTGEGQDYRGLVSEIVKFFKTRKPPVPPEETLELLAFMEAADKSKEQRGAPVPMPKISLE